MVSFVLFHQKTHKNCLTRCQNKSSSRPLQHLHYPIYYTLALFLPGFVRLPPHLPSLNHASVIPEKSSPPNPSQYLKHWRLSTKASKADRAAAGTVAAGLRAGRPRANPEPTSPDKLAQMLKMITALEELQRTFNSTLSSRITIMPRGSPNPV